MQYHLLTEQPYTYTQEDLLFETHVVQNGLQDEDLAALRTAFFSKSRACLRASPLPKTYGWGLHFNEQGKIALYGKESAEYARLIQDQQIEQVKAMRNKRGK
ncbi:DUF6157 family protein [Paenibacillus pinihumi]|uniref:DUF6157 family protein n=1 Tax=Paenibacillus pinihumi TaxID=669462 RepID=UPI0024813F92|nr:DUF6157 family protein [Paenibacillus pinihumi]